MSGVQGGEHGEGWRRLWTSGRWIALAGVLACLALPVGAQATTTTSIQASEVTSMQSLYGIDCVSASTCYAVGTDDNGNPALLTLTNGTPGAVTEFSDQSFEPAGIACPQSGKCLVVGNDIDEDAGDEVGAFVPVTNGTPGATVDVSSTSSLLAIGCSGYGYCIVAGQDQTDDFGTVEIANGQPGAFAVISDQNFQGAAVACESATRCIVAGEDGLPPQSTGAISVVTGGAPGATATSTDTIALSGVACTTAGSCDAVGTANSGNDSNGYPVPVPSVSGIVGGQFGSTWDYGDYSDGGMNAAACGSSTTCVALGDDDNGDQVATPILNGSAGAAELLQTDPSIGQVELDDLACPSASSCVAIGQDAYANPVVATVPVPAYQAQSPTVTGAGGAPSPVTGTGPSTGTKHKSTPKSGRGRKPTRLLIAVTWPTNGPVRELTIAVRCESTGNLAGVEGVRIRLEDRAAGSRRWRAAGSARTRKVGGVKGEARFHAAAQPGMRMQYRAILTATRTYAGSVSVVKTVVVLS